MLLWALGCGTQSCCGMDGGSGVIDSDDSALQDLDGDGFPAPADCNDDDPGIHPEATELCNGVDDDCDELVDDSDDSLDLASAYPWFEDSDGDGYGDSSALVMACDRPHGHADLGGDCDDTDPSIAPSATEVCDGVDRDCNGVIDDGCPQAPVGLVTLDGALRITGVGTADSHHPGAGFVAVITSDVIGDDGHSDVVVSDPVNGAVYVFAGPLSTSVGTTAAALRLDGDDMFGYAVVDLGDANGDGTSDLLVTNVSGQASVFYGPHESQDASGAVTIMHGSRKIAGGRDLTGNGLPDLMFGYPTALHMDDKGDAGYFDGQVEIYESPVLQDADADDAWLVLRGESEWDFLGYSFEMVGDVDGDGLQDIAVSHGGSSGYQGAGRFVHVLYGPFTAGVRDLGAGDADIITPTYSFEHARLAGRVDFDGDGGEDFLVAGSDSQVEHGQAFLFTSPPTGHSYYSEAKVHLEHSADTELDGCFPGDIDGDGAQDLLLAALATGTAHLFYGPLSGSLAVEDSDATLVGVSALTNAGIAIGCGGDVTGDVYPDMLIGDPYETLGDTVNGVTFVVPGGPLLE